MWDRVAADEFFPAPSVTVAENGFLPRPKSGVLYAVRSSDLWFLGECPPAAELAFTGAAVLALAGNSSWHFLMQVFKITIIAVARHRNRTKIFFLQTAEYCRHLSSLLYFFIHKCSESLFRVPHVPRPLAFYQYDARVITYTKERP